MFDKNNVKIKEGDNIFFLCGNYDWSGVCISVNENTETARFRVTRRETGVGMIETLNFIECNRYITILTNG